MNVLADSTDIARTLQTAATSGSSSLRAFAIVDGALLRQLPEHARRRWSPAKGRSLFTHADNGAAEVGPLLFDLSVEQLAGSLPATLVDSTNGLAAGSFILSTASTDELVACLAALVDVTLDDGADMVMRYFDSRVLPFWLAMLEPDYRAFLARAVGQWVFWQADFTLRIVKFDHSSSDTVQPKLPMKLSRQQEDGLLNACYPHTLIERFRAEDPGALAKVPVSKRYEFFHQQIERAQGHGLTSQGDVEGYCGVAIEFGPQFDEDAAAASALATLNSGKSFAEAIGELTDADWQRMREVR